MFFLILVKRESKDNSKKAMENYQFIIIYDPFKHIQRQLLLRKTALNNHKLLYLIILYRKLQLINYNFWPQFIVLNLDG